ncbi:MAG: rhodanese-like domain-containing protein [Deltaproteobacteria bacterium]|jgi:rhodanese-related sulfurtransferase|nr:rhodanese-like domain-containing protein [Deltaproteobacteria bacterium]
MYAANLLKKFTLALVVVLALGSLAIAKVTVEGAAPAQAKEGAYNVKKFLNDAKNQKIVVIDVRTLGEYAMGHLPEATNVPIATSLEGELKNFHKDKTIVFMCAAGKRAGAAYYMVKDKRPEIADKVFFLDAAVQYLPGGDVVIKPNQ